MDATRAIADFENSSSFALATKVDGSAPRDCHDVQPCPVCDSTTHQLVYEKSDFPILRCHSCGLGSTGNTDTLSLSAIYTEEYFQGKRKDGYADYAGSEMVLRTEFRRIVKELRRFVVSGGRLLDVGCAFGFFLMEARQFYRCVGIEISEAAVRFCRRRRLPVKLGTLDNLSVRKESFDAVVMLDVIEHLSSPLATVQKCTAILRPGGILMVATGDWNSILSRVMGRHWRLMTPPQHLFFFSRPTLCRLLERAGFDILSVKRPVKVVPLGLATYQLGSRIGVPLRPLEALNHLGVPINLFDTIRVVARKR